MLTSRQKVLDIFNRKNVDHKVFWTGHPNDKTVPIYAKEWGIEASREAIYSYLDDDCRWVMADAGYKHPEGKRAFDPSYGMVRNSLSAPGCFANAQSVKDIETYPWPDPDYCDFDDVYKEIDTYQDKAVFTGMWSSFFHIISDFFGMENYFVNMYENPKVIEAATEKMVDFYVETNDRFFKGLGDRADSMFFGNDFGSQLDLLISPENFRKFILPSFKRLIAVGKKYNKKIILHSCGSIYRIIPDLIDAGVDVIHPIQAQASGMSAKELAKYKDHLAFLGGIDAQSFIVNSSPKRVRDEVKRVKEILGPNIVVSLSHEEILPNVPAANILAMARAAKE